MAHFALLDNSNIVQNIVVVNNEDITDENGIEQESLGIEFCQRVIGPGRWLKTSRNTSRGVHVNPDTYLPDDGVPFRGNFAQVGYQYLPDLDVFMPPKPNPWLVPTSYGTWVAPFPLNINTGEAFTHEELEYIFFYMRHTKEFRICPAVPLDPDDEFNSIACTTTGDYMYPTFEEAMYGFNRFRAVSEAVIEGDKFFIPHIHFILKEIDLTPIVLFVHAGWEELNIDVASDALNCHPQTGARTIHELFRLIIEWGFAYTEFGNREPVAVKCHQILCELQMPLDVRNELLEQIEPQAVERYLKGQDPFRATSYDVVSDPPMPPLFEAWYEGVRVAYKGRYTSVDVPVNMSELPTTYPM